MNLDLIGIENNKDHNYMVFDVPYVRENQQAFIEESGKAHAKFDDIFQHNHLGSTWNYRFYNIFSLALNSLHYYYLFKILNSAIRHYVGNDQPLWISSWLNYHYPEDILKWHNHHESICHGYISLDPKNTNTRFEHYNIKNEVGRIYIGPSYNFHEVVVNEPFVTPRITIAFDIFNYSQKEPTYKSLALIPLL